jgi:hypothetical protein
MGDKQYPLFIPPAPLGEKTNREWSLAEAKAYFDWQLSVIDEHIRGLLDYFG